MKIHLASHYGMCFGVRDAIAQTQEIAEIQSATVLGELVHNPVVQKKLDAAGVAIGSLDSKPQEIKSEAVVLRLMAWRIPFVTPGLKLERRFLIRLALW